MNKRYTIEFKKQAVELAEGMGSTLGAARQLGIPDVNIHQWKKRFGKASSDGKSKNSEAPNQNESEELKRLRKENSEQKQIIHILKRAAAFFSQDHLK
jgi:transposase